MSIGTNGIFSSTISVSSGHWKPVNAPASGAAGSAMVVTGGTDDVSVSKLGKALTGVAAKLFEQLDPKARTMLEDFVNSGKASADDVVRGLRGLAQQAVFDRYAAETPLTAEETQQSADRAAASKRHAEYMSGLENVMKERQSINDAESRGDISSVDAFARSEAVFKKADAYTKDFEARNGSVSGSAQTDLDALPINRMLRNFKNSDLFGDDGGGDVLSAKDGSAANKLRALGFSGHMVTDAAKRYADGVDLTALGGRGPAASADQVTLSSTNPQKAGTSPAERFLDTELAAAAAAPSASGAPSNGQTAISLLRSAQDRITSPLKDRD
ncbi:hypothetical protein [Azospirillum rugosum]|uniref:Uncharacterized protein n=1 Tax=Azospirillum rugosum TaxID=416170 RepID=A0ABS4SFL9_9PROT|nr:hypothetical protein [Azospirillum rugosum]MBP2290989.1 hypothetical protein [Azospirillum rugosum]MDQ0524947.1 hypothetical protein [Azospirillum rugosum]